MQQKSNALQSQLANGKHQQLRGIALYKNMITDFLQGVNGRFYPEKKEEKEMAVSNASMYHQEIADSLTVAEESLREEDANDKEPYFSCANAGLRPCYFGDS